MRILFLSLLLLGCFAACSFEPEYEKKPLKIPIPTHTDAPSAEWMSDFPALLDSQVVRQDTLLWQRFLTHYAGEIGTPTPKLEAFHKAAIYGATDSIWVLAYRGADSTCLGQPFRRQLFFSQKGRLLHQSEALSYRFDTLLSKHSPILCILEVDCKAQGDYYLYRYEAGVFIDILDKVSVDIPRLYDTQTYSPAALTLSVEVQDSTTTSIAFQGLQIDSQRAVKNSVKWTFRYSPSKDLFVFESSPNQNTTR